MQGLYDSYSASNNAGQYLQNNDWLNTGVKLPPLSMGWDSQQMPGMSGIDTSGLPDYNAGLYNQMKNSDWNMGDTSDLIGGLGGLYSMYQGNQMMGLAKDDMRNRKRALDYNISSDKAFKSGVQSSFR